MSSTTTDVLDFLVKQLAELGSLADYDPTKKGETERAAMTIEAAKATAVVADKFTQVVRAQLDAARIMSEHGIVPTSIGKIERLSRVGTTSA